MSDKSHYFVENLIQLREARDVLTEQEYAENRAGILDELATFTRVPLWVNGMFLGLCAAGVALIVLVASPGGKLGGTVLLLGSLFFWWSIHRGYAARRRLTRSERFEIVVDLIDKNLLTFEEADALRERIRRLFQDHR